MKPHVTAEWHNHRLVVFGCPDPADESHNCDAMGCGSVGPHVLEYLSAIEAAQELYRLRERVTKMTAELLTSEEAIARRIASAVSLVRDEYQRTLGALPLVAERDALESPPVVPEGWGITPENSDGAPGWWITLSPEATGYNVTPPAVLRALAWAREHDQRPPHEGDS